MPTTSSPWATRRQIMYFLALFFAVVGISAFIFLFLLQSPPTCFDGKRNNQERGVDCGGPCAKLCPAQVEKPRVLWTRIFKVRAGQYSAVALVENQNHAAGTVSIPYKFEIFNKAGELLVERRGYTFLPPKSTVPIFEGRFELQGKEPSRAFFEFESEAEWLSMEPRRGDIIVRNQSLTNIDTSPRLQALIENTSIKTFKDIDVVAIVYDIRDNAVAASRTEVDQLVKDEQHALVFTWPEPFPTEVERCSVPANVELLLDVSGSMNDDGLDPPQPITDAKNAAMNFIDRMGASDRIGVVSFATEASVVHPLNSFFADARRSVQSLLILPEEEFGLTNIGAAISFATDELYRTSVSNSELEGEQRKVIVLLTDGRANTPKEPGGEVYALTQAARAKAGDTTVYTIGLGDKVNVEFLRLMATSESEYFQAVSSKDLDNIYRQISESLCERAPAVVDIIPLSSDFLVPLEP